MDSNIVLKIKSLLLIFLVVSCASQKRRFKSVVTYESKKSAFNVRNGFIGLNDTLSSKQIEYKRFILRENNKTVFDGYLSLNSSDTIYFIPYNSVIRNCDDKLIFYIKNNENSHYLGRSCDDEEKLHFPTDVLVSYQKDTIFNKKTYHRFSHSIVSIDDYKDDSDAIISERQYLINFDYGIVLEQLTNDNFSPYWYNY